VNGWSVPQPIIGWGPQHAGTFHAEKTDPQSGVSIYKTDYTIDTNLLRETRSAESGPTIAFFGDSFTFGEGVSDSETLPQLFADSLGRKERVLNLGFPGNGPQQFLAELQSGRFDGVIGNQPRLFIFLTGAAHAERSACKPFWVRKGPRYALENGEVVLKGLCYEGLRLWAREWLANTASYRLFAEPYLQKATHEDIELYIRIIIAAVNLAKEKYGAATLIPYMGPDLVLGDSYLEGTSFTDGEIIQRLRNGGAMVVDVGLTSGGCPDELCIKGDGHPTPMANRRRASIIKDYIERHAPEILFASVR
jgi:hypothetical protein